MRLNGAQNRKAAKTVADKNNIFKITAQLFFKTFIHALRFGLEGFGNWGENFIPFS